MAFGGRRAKAHPARKRAPAPTIAGLALLCLVAQAASIVHPLFVPHARCAEHGEWVHSEAIAKSATPRATGSSVESSTAPDRHVHDHCLVLGHRHDLAPASATKLAERRGSRDAATVPRLESREGISAAVYRFAPKASPPAPPEQRARA